MIERFATLDRGALWLSAAVAAALRFGTPIGGMDLMIAAHARAEVRVVVIHNASEFHRVPSMAVEEWALNESGSDPLLSGDFWEKAKLRLFGGLAKGEDDRKDPGSKRCSEPFRQVGLCPRCPLNARSSMFRGDPV